MTHLIKMLEYLGIFVTHLLNMLDFPDKNDPEISRTFVAHLLKKGADISRIFATHLIKHAGVYWSSCNSPDQMLECLGLLTTTAGVFRSKR